MKHSCLHIAYRRVCQIMITTILDIPSYFPLSFAKHFKNTNHNIKHLREQWVLQEKGNHEFIVDLSTMVYVFSKSSKVQKWRLWESSKIRLWVSYLWLIQANTKGCDQISLWLCLLCSWWSYIHTGLKKIQYKVDYVIFVDYDMSTGGPLQVCVDQFNEPLSEWIRDEVVVNAKKKSYYIWWRI